MRQTKIIALAGPKGVGKTTIAKVIEEVLIDAEIHSFAAPIKSMIEAMGIGRNLIDDPELKNQPIDWVGKSPREMMQTLGTEWGRQMVRDDIWLRVVAEKIKYSPVGTVIIDDCRFDNEAEFVNNSGGVVIDLFRDGVEASDGHISESGISEKLIRARVDAGDPYEAALLIFKAQKYARSRV